MSFIGVKIVLVCNAFDKVAIPLSCSLCPHGDSDAAENNIDYRLESLSKKKLQTGYGYVHCTLVQLCIRATELTDVKEAARKVWNVHREAAEESKEKLELTDIHPGPVFGTTATEKEIRLPYIAITRTDALMALHSDMLEKIKPFQVKLSSMNVGKSAFHNSSPADGNASVECMIDFYEKNSLENYSPHLTLGSTQDPIDTNLLYFQKLKLPLHTCALMVSHMGNYCSCFELL
ncbi:unnamed protein product [Phytomonas sp. Hart1]|nr:unnamed protein product [Phytomonas sp. Hart1]|eukprot:CCW69911.1 unnamed protein product [Phytomonas sp. isolate Hart1]